MKQPSVFVPRRLSAVDAALLERERPHAPLHLGVAAIVEGRLCPERLARRIESRLWRLGNLGRAVSDVPLALARPAFEDPALFDPRDHIQTWALPAPGGESELMQACARVFAAPLDRTRPLFEIHVVEGLHGDRSAALCKLHPALARSGARGALLEALLDPVEDDPIDAASPPRPRLRSGPARRIGQALVENVGNGLVDTWRVLSIASDPPALRAAVTQLRSSARALLGIVSDAAPATPWNGPLGPRRKLEVTRLPLREVERIAIANACSASEVVVCVLAGALHRFLQSSGASRLRTDLRVFLPLWRRAHDSQPGVASLSARVVRLPLDVGDERLRLGTVLRAIREVDANGSRDAASHLVELADRLPPSLAGALSRNLPMGRIANVVVALGEGPRGARWLCGQRVVAIHPFAPVIDGVGLSVATYSHGGSIFVGLNADADRVPDLEKLRASLEQSFSALAQIG